MKDRYYGIVTKKPRFGCVIVDHSSLLWAIVQVAEGLDPHQIESLVLGQLSPACELAAELVGVDYPNDHGPDELDRNLLHNDLICAVETGEYLPLSKLLELRLGTPETYSIVLAVALACHGHPVELAITGPDADPPKYPFVVLPERSIDLFWTANGGKPRSLRAHLKVPL